MRLPPETNRNPDWPRKVRAALSDAAGSIRALVTRASNLETRADDLETATDWSALADYADDTAAAVGGVAVGELYRTGSIVKVRVT